MAVSPRAGCPPRSTCGVVFDIPRIGRRRFSWPRRSGRRPAGGKLETWPVCAAPECSWPVSAKPLLESPWAVGSRHCDSMSLEILGGFVVRTKLRKALPDAREFLLIHNNYLLACGTRPGRVREATAERQQTPDGRPRVSPAAMYNPSRVL